MALAQTFGKLAVLGGGSPFTAALIDSLEAVSKVTRSVSEGERFTRRPSSSLGAPALAHASGYKPRVLALHGRDAEHLAAVVRYGAARLQPLGWDVRGETEMASALTEADTVIHQIRYGGLETRGAGEELCTRHRVAADETLGPAALLTAVRLRNDLDRTCGLLQRHCPNAWVLNLTNPLSCVTALMVERGVRNCLGVCELPEFTARQVAKALGVPFDEMTWSYTGLNHRGFLHDLRINGQDVLDDLLRTLRSGTFEGIAATDIQSLRAVPLKYFRLVGCNAELPPSRVPFLSGLREQVFAELSAHPTVSPPSLRQRDLSWYSQAVVPVLAALESSTPKRLIVNRAAADRLVREEAVLISRDCLEPIVAPAVSAAAQSWLERFETHERLFCDAVRQPSRSRIREVLANDALVPCDKVAELETELWERGVGATTPSSRLRVAIVGAGRMGRERASAAAQCEASVVAVCDPDPACGQKLADEHARCKYLASWEDLDWDSLDAVFVCTPPFARGPVEIAAIEAGVPFFVEKPIGLSAQHVRPIRDALRNRPVLNAVGYMNRYRKSVQRARDALAGQTVLGATSRWLCGNYRVSWWNQKQLSGGPLNEQATHLVDLTRFLLGEVAEVQALAEPLDWQTSQLQTAAINLRLTSGALHSIFYSCEAATKWIGFEAFTANRHVHLDSWDLQWREADGPPTAPATDRNAVFRDEVQAFLNAIRLRSATILCDFEDAFRTQQTVDAIHEALISRQVMSLQTARDQRVRIAA